MMEMAARPKPTKDDLLEILRDVFSPNDLLETFPNAWEELQAVRKRWQAVWRRTEYLRHDHWWSMESRLTEDNDISFYASIGLFDPADETPCANFPALLQDINSQVIRGAFVECYVNLPKVRDPLLPNRTFKDFLQEALNALATIYKISCALTDYERQITT